MQKRFLPNSDTSSLYHGSFCLSRIFFFAAAFVGLRADDLATAHATHAPRTGRSHSFAGQVAGLLHRSGELSFVELVVLVDRGLGRYSDPGGPCVISSHAGDHGSAKFQRVWPERVLPFHPTRARPFPILRLLDQL